MKSSFTLRETFMATAIVALMALAILPLLQQTNNAACSEIDSNAIETVIKRVSPSSRKLTRNGWDGPSFVRLCYTFDVPEEDSNNFLAELRLGISTEMQKYGWQIQDRGSKLFKDDIEELYAFKDGNFVDVALYTLDDLESPPETDKIVGSSCRRIRFVVARHLIR